MSFVQLEFLAFLAATLLLVWSVPARRQNHVLLVASAVFYGWVHPWFLALLFGSATLDFVVARQIVRRPRWRRVWLACSLAGNLGLLAWFKYAGFLVENVAAALTALGLQPGIGTLEVLLPVGISFYTFQTLSYTIDVYRGELAPRRNLVDYLLYVSFFPQLVAGPIERAGRLLPQIEAPRVFAADRLVSGASLALWGAFQKLVVADTLAPWVDQVFRLREPAGPLLWCAAAAFMVQVYADLSGYTCLARGVARMFGVELVRNFDRPWRATTTPEFWSRWHISVSHWVRDYVLLPLLGDRPGAARQVAALTATLLIMGAWHGAGWNYLLFGLYHAVWMVLYTALARAGWHPRGALAAAFHLVAVGLVGALIFREPSVGRLFEHLSRPWSTSPEEWTAVAGLVGVAACTTGLLVVGHLVRQASARLEGTPWLLPARATGWALQIVGVLVFYRDTAADFLYFRF